jgi:hypothetical protein
MSKKTKKPNQPGNLEKVLGKFSTSTGKTQ